MALVEVTSEIYQVTFDDFHIEVLLFVKNNSKSLEIYFYVSCQLSSC